MKKQLVPLLILILISVLHSCKEDNDDNLNLTVKDFDGNIYKTVEIGEQIWMGENLKTTHYPNGTALQLVENGTDWSALGYTDKTMCYYNNSITNKDIYGALYTWAAAMNGVVSSSANPSNVQGVCPNGWHLPSDDEWKELEMYLGMNQTEVGRFSWRGTNEGSKLAGNSSLWANENLENDIDFGLSGFMALPAGYRYYNGTFSHLGMGTNFWSTTESGDSLALNRFLFCYNTDVYRFTGSKKVGFSVRCIKD